MAELKNDRRILFFVKYPHKGTVKTRLARDLHGVSVEEIYRTFVLDSLALLESTTIPFSICYSPEDDKSRFASWLGTHRTFIPQHGQDLGQRMRNCFHHAFSQGCHRVIALGSDSPDLPSSFITNAFFCLKTHDSVIGPCEDGGYYLIGFKNDTFLWQAFHEISWSTDRVLSQTLERLTTAGRKTIILPPWRDVDTVDDLKDLYARGLTTAFRSSKTMALLAKHGDVIPIATQPHSPPV